VLVTAASVQDSVAGTHARPGRCRPPHDPQGLGRRRLPQALRRPGRYPRHRPGGHRPHSQGQVLHSDSEAVGGRADLWPAHAPPQPGPRRRNPARSLRSHDPPGDDRRHGPPPRRRSHHLMA
jgi:hypothetical protein